MRETPEQAKAIVYAPDVAVGLRRYAGRCTELKLDMLARAYADAAARIDEGAAVQLALFRGQGTLFEQHEREVFEREPREIRKPHAALEQELSTLNPRIPPEDRSERESLEQTKPSKRPYKNHDRSGHRNRSR